MSLDVPEVPDLLQPVNDRAQQPKPKPLAEAIRSGLDDERDDFVNSLKTVANISPDEYGQATVTERLSGIPAATLYQHREQMAKLQQGNRYAAIYDRARKTANALRDSNLAAVSQDDLDTLIRIEGAASDTRYNEQSTGEKFLGAIQQQWLQMSQATNVSDTADLVRLRQQFDAIDSELETASNTGRQPYADGNEPGGFGGEYLRASPEQRQIMRDNLDAQQGDRLSRVVEQQGELEAFPVDPGARRIQELKDAGQSSFDATLEAISEQPGFAFRQAGAAAATSAPALVAGVIGGVPLASAFNFMTERDIKFADVIREAGVDFNDPAAVLKALQDDELMATARQKARLKAAGTTAVDAMGMLFAGKLLAPTKVAGRPLTETQRELANLAVQFPVQGVSEAAGEAAGQFAAEGEVDSGEVLLEGVAGGLGSTADVLAFGGGRTFDTLTTGLRQSRQARMGRQALDQAAAAAVESKTRSRDPGVFNAIAQQQLAGSPLETVWIPAEALQRLNQSGMLDLPKILAQVPGLEEQFGEAVARGGTVAIKGADYLTYLADVNEQLSGSIRLNAEAMSSDDAAAWSAEQEEHISQLAEQFRAGPDAQAEALRDFTGELVQAGFRRADAEQYAAVHLSVLNNLAERTGQALEQLRQQFPLDVRNQAPKDLRRVTIDDATLAIQRLRAGDIPESGDILGKTLGEYLRDAGGVNDEGGELAALDVDVGRVGRNRITRRGGLSLDDAAMQAWERGYFPGVPREQVGPQLIVDAVRDELAGSPRYSSEQENPTLRDQAETLRQLGEFYDRLGVNLGELSDEEALAILRNPEQVPGERLEQFAGMQAETADRYALDVAASRLLNGEDPEQIRKETGWFKGADGRWRFEIADGDARLTPRLDSMRHAERDGEQITSVTYREAGGLWVLSVVTDGMQTPADIIEITTSDVDSLAPTLGTDLVERLKADEGEPHPLSDNDNDKLLDGAGDTFRAPGGKWSTLGELLDHPALFAAYPQLQRLKVVYAPEILGPQVHGAMSVNARTGEPIMVIGNGDPREVRKTVLHETQHAIQSIEGFARGGSPDEFRNNPEAVAKVAEQNQQAREQQWETEFPEAAAARDEVIKLRTDLTATYGDAFSDEAMASDLFSQYEQAIEDAYATEGYDQQPISNIAELAPLEIYHRLAGEIEARNVESRADFSPAVARAVAPSRTADTKDDQAIVWWSGEEMHSDAIDAQADADVRLNQGAAGETRQQLQARLIEETPGLKLDLAGSGKRVTLSRIELSKEGREQGAGSRVMQSLIGWADANGVALQLSPSGDFGGNKKRLGEFYKRFGFIENKGRNKDFEFSETMYREPQQRLEQGGEDDQARGFITFSPRGQGDRRFAITLGEKRDLSTLLHELGHYYLEVIQDLAQADNAPQQIKDDVATIRQWVGAEGDAPLTTEQHEQFARGFESYLAEGKAPAPELAGAFARFKRWLIAIYKDLRRLNVELSDDVRRVFDRIVASDAQIQAAEQVSAALPLFKDAAAAGMTEQEFAAYQNSVELAHADARDAVEEEIVREEERRQSAWWREQLGKIRQEVTEEVDLLPEYVALKALRSGQAPDGSAAPFKLNSGELAERYGAPAVRKLAFTHSKGGLPLDIAASALGFESGDAMVKALMGVQPRAQVIEEETQRRMEERHGPRQTGEAAERAMHAVHNERRADVLAKELRRLAQVGNRRNVTSQQILKEAAARVMSERKVRDIQPIEYQRAETKASRESLEAFVKGDLEAAYQAKQRQLLNFYLYREAVKARQQVDSIVSRLNGYNKAKTRQRIGKAGGDYLDQIDAVMEQYEFRNVSLRQLDKAKTFGQWYNDQVAAGNDPFVPEFVLNTLGRTNYKELSLAKLEELDEFVAHLDHLASLKGKLQANKRIKDQKDAEALLIQALVDNLAKQAPRALNDTSRSLPQAMGDWLADANSSLMKLEQIIAQADGGDANGAWSTIWWQPLAEAQAQRDDLNRAITAKLMAATDAWFAQAGARAGQKVYIQSLGKSLDMNGILAAALNSGNASNLKKLLAGNQWSEAVHAEILGKLKEEDWRYVAELWEIVNSLWPQIVALEKQVNGIAPEKVEGIPVDTPFGVVQGGYWPLVYDFLSPDYAKILANLGDLSPLNEQGGVRASTPRGHTKARIDGFSAPIVLDVTVIANHLSGVIHDLTHRVAISDARKLISAPTVRQVMNERMGPFQAQQFVNILDGIANDLAPGSARGIGIFRRTMNTLRSNAAIAWMGYSATTMFNQIGGASQALEYFAQKGQRKAYLRALAKFAMNPLQTRADVMAMSGEMRNRSVNLDPTIRDTMTRVIRVGEGRIGSALNSIKNGHDAIRRFAFVPMAAMQSLVDTPVWMAAYEAEGGVNNHDAAVQAADRAVRLTQMAGGAKDLAPIQQNEMAKFFLMVYGYASLLWNRNVDIARSTGRAVKNRDVRGVALALERFVYLNIIPTILAGAIKGALPPDDGEDDDKLGDTWPEYLAVQTLLSVTSGIPLVRDAAAGFFSDFGYGGITPLGGGIDALIRATNSSKSEALATNMTTAVGMLTGIPSSQLNRAIRTWYDLEEGELDDDGLSIARSLLLGPPPKQD